VDLGTVIGAAIAILGFALEGWAFFGDHFWHEKPERDPRNLRPPF
jgi:hypothetical protein